MTCVCFAWVIWGGNEESGLQNIGMDARREHKRVSCGYSRVVGIDLNGITQREVRGNQGSQSAKGERCF